MRDTKPAARRNAHVVPHMSLSHPPDSGHAAGKNRNRWRIAAVNMYFGLPNPIQRTCSCARTQFPAPAICIPKTCPPLSLLLLSAPIKKFPPRLSTDYCFHPPSPKTRFQGCIKSSVSRHQALPPVFNIASGAVERRPRRHLTGGCSIF